MPYLSKTMAFSHENPTRTIITTPVSRRVFIRTLFSASTLAGFFVAPGESPAKPTSGQTVLNAFLGEELHYRIGFWLFSHCAEARTRLCETQNAGIYQASMVGRTVGFVDWLLGRYRYAYISYAGYDKNADRLYPLYFKLTKKRKNKISIRSVTFNYTDRELLFAWKMENGKESHEIVAMKKAVLYEDYLTLFYNFRHGYYGPIERDRTYHLPLHIHKGFNFLDLMVASTAEAEAAKAKEVNTVGKDYLLKFRVLKEDVSSMSGEIEGWLSKELVPTKGIIKDVIFFGDLWGELVNRTFTNPRCKTPNHEKGIFYQYANQ